MAALGVDDRPVVAQPRLVGRDAELERIRSLVVDHRRSVVIAGRTGVGKSRLGREVLDQCRAAGVPVAQVTASRSSSGIPLGAFASWLPAEQPAVGEADDRATLLRRCADALIHDWRGSPLVLGLDDAHLLDDMSATLVQQVVDSGAVVVIATVRSGEPTPDPIVSLWKGQQAERIELGGLGPADVGEVLTSALGGRPDDATVARFVARARGNMLFLVELIAGAVSDGVLREEGGAWRLLGDLRPSDRLVELVEDRLEGLSAVERELLEVVALGEPLDLEVLVQLGDEAVAEQLERKALLVISSRRSRVRVRLAHPVYGDVLRGRMPQLRARSVARVLARALEARGRPSRGDLLRIATWRLTGGGGEPRLMLEAAVEARWRYDFRLAEQLARVAVDGGAGTRAAVLAAQLASLQGRTAQADRELGELARQAATPEERGQVALVRLDNRVIYAGTIDEGLRIALGAEAELPESELRKGITARRAALLLAKEGPQRALEVLQPLLSDATGRVLAWACMPGAYSLGRLGRISEALDAAERGSHAQSALTTPADWYPFMHRFYEVEALQHAGRFDDGRRTALACYREGVENGSLEQQAMFSWQLAKPVVDRGYVQEAERWARQAIGIYRRLDRGQFVDFCYIYLAQALAMAGRGDEARDALSELEGLGIEPSYFMGVDLGTTRGWVEAADGHARRAMEHFLAAADEGARIGDRVGSLAALHACARVGYPDQVLGRVDELGTAVEGELATARRAHVHALSERDPRALEATSASFEAMGALVLAAESAADAAVCWTHAEDGRHRSAAERRAAQLAALCESPRTPALCAVETRAHLTAAEREAARLAASGMSNRAIAEELVVSVRTVENRLQNVYGKLGVRNRRALADTMHTMGDG